ncbi:MAG: 6,7-dimethyl-8-ribityllumazine synthase [Thermodesulfobacteriota bacterium]
MPIIHEGTITAEGLRVAIVASRFNEFMCARLLEGALDALLRHGARDEDLHVIRVPGAFEIPAMARWAAQSGRFDAVICLGVVIRGGTPHFEYIAAEVSKGVAQVAMEASVPVVFGVLTTDTMEQAIERAGSKAGNKGWDAAMAAMELVQLRRRLTEEL